MPQLALGRHEIERERRLAAAALQTVGRSHWFAAKPSKQSAVNVRKRALPAS
jgi:hypothetical protein